MKKEEYLESLFKAFNEGSISEEAYDQALMNIDDFCEADEQKESSVSTEEIKSLSGLISMGLDVGLIHLSVRENTMSAQIGEHWFYFSDCYVEENFDFLSVAKNHLVMEIVNSLLDIKDNLMKEEYYYYTSYLEENLLKELKEDLEPQLKTERDGWGNPIAFVSFGNDSIELTFEKEYEHYSVLMHDREGAPRLPYISAKNLDDVLKAAIADYDIAGSLVYYSDVLKDNIRDWYMRNYPTDNLGPEITEGLTFESFYFDMQKGKHVYGMLGKSADSIIRERVFSETAKRFNVDYDVIYNLWLEGPKKDISLGNGKKPKIDVLINDAKDKSSKGINEENGKKKELLGDSLKWR